MKKSRQVIAAIVLAGVLAMGWSESSGEPVDKPVASQPATPRRPKPSVTHPTSRPDYGFRAERFPNNPIIKPGMDGLEGGLGSNINGPSLIAVPPWIDKPLGKYYLYFAHHGGDFIRLAYADKIEGPWKIHRGGVLRSRQGPGRGHVASPDVHVDNQARQIRMYFHQPRKADGTQVSYVALSRDGLSFEARPDELGCYYFRVFRHGQHYYALAKGKTGGVMSRSSDGLKDFQPGPEFIPHVRHTAVWVEGDTACVAYTVIGDKPERLFITRVDLTGEWTNWTMPPGQLLLEPQEEWEGGDLPLTASSRGAATRPVRQLRDPAIFAEGGKRYLLYSVAGEQGIAIAELHGPAAPPSPVKLPDFRDSTGRP